MGSYSPGLLKTKLHLSMVSELAFGPHAGDQATHSYLHELKPDLRLSHISVPLDPIEVLFEAGDRLHWIAKKVCAASPHCAISK